MPRPRRCRRVGFRPGVTYFKPAGVRMRNLKEVILSVDEYESVRLKDLDGLDQEEAAKKMDVSQPTFNRLLKVIGLQSSFYKTRSDQLIEIKYKNQKSKKNEKWKISL